MNYRKTVYACYLGYITQAIINNLAPLLFVTFQKQFALSLSQVTLLILMNFGTQLLVDLISARFADCIGIRTCIASAHLFCTAGLVGLGIFPLILPPFGCSKSKETCTPKWGLLPVPQSATIQLSCMPSMAPFLEIFSAPSS